MSFKLKINSIFYFFLGEGLTHRKRSPGCLPLVHRNWNNFALDMNYQRYHLNALNKKEKQARDRAQVFISFTDTDTMANSLTSGVVFWLSAFIMVPSSKFI